MEGPGYGPAHNPGLPPAASSTAKLALGLGIFSPFCCGVLTGLPAVVIAVMAVREIDRSGGRLGGRTLALAGGALGGMGILMTIIGLAINVNNPRPPRAEPTTTAAPTPAKESSPLGRARVECVGSGPTTVSCSIISEGVGSAKACWDTVLECGGITHRAHACSSLMPSGSKEGRTVRDFSPAIDPTVPCDAIRVEKLEIK